MLCTSDWPLPVNNKLLTHCRLNELPHSIYWKILISILGMSGYVIKIFLEKFELFANSGDLDQMPCSTASDLGLHCLQITLLKFSRLQWVYRIHVFPQAELRN